MNDPLLTIFNIGLDLVDISRLANSINNGKQPFLDKLFTASEQQYCKNGSRPHEHFAARFAAKEAAMKVLGTGWSGGIKFTDFEVSNDSNGCPSLSLSGHALETANKLGIVKWQISLSHTGDTAGAVAQAFSAHPGA
ncbi:MAG: holo-ACP synthase [Planctomycetes bacterium]|nr:holo-ACP synthase [Planctomycetota bacterium]